MGNHLRGASSKVSTLYAPKADFGGNPSPIWRLSGCIDCFRCSIPNFQYVDLFQMTYDEYVHMQRLWGQL